VKLPFLTVELERTERVDDLVRLRSPARRALKDCLPRRALAGIAAAIGVSAAAVAGWSIPGAGAGLASPTPSWLPMGLGAPASGPGTVHLDITSVPADATVLIDRHERGTTPLSVAVTKGRHTLVLTHSTAVDDERELDISSDMHVNVTMFERRPDAVQLKPAYPGSSINGATFLDDGRVALAMELPGQAGDGMLNEAWVFDPATGTLTPFAASANPRAGIMVVSPDGNRVAYARPLHADSTQRKRLAEVVVGGSDGVTAAAVFALSPPNDISATGSATNGEVEEVRDVAWTPDSRHLLVIVRLVGVAGGPPSASRSRILLVDAGTADGQQAPPSELPTLPADVVPGSYSWSPDGHWVALLTKATNGSGGTDFTALCALDINAAGDVAGFRYVADLARQSDPASPTPVADVAWSPAGDSRLLYTAPTPKSTVSNPLGLPTTSGGDPGLFAAIPAGPALTAEEGQRLGSATGLFAPAWLDTGDAAERLIALARSDKGSRPLVIQGVDAVSGTIQNLGIALPTGVGGSAAVAARWDVRHGRLLLLARRGASSPGLDYWVVQVLAQGARS
jgi:PEGA domain